MRRLLEQTGHVLVRFRGGLAQMPRPALGLVGKDAGPVRRRADTETQGHAQRVTTSTS